MRKLILTLTILLSSTVFFKVSAQYYGSFVVQGDADKFYPVVFSDVDFDNNKATVLDIGRSNVHTDGTWRGSEIARFRFHTYNWGNSSNFIDADIRQFNPVTNTAFIAAWSDGSMSNSDKTIIIWLKGGGNTYFVNAPADINATVYDGVQHPLPYQETNGPARNYITTIQPYVNSNGFSSGGTAFFNGTGNSYFGSNVGIGTYNPDAKLTVQGTVHATEVLVDQTVPTPDYVFDKDYDLASLKDVKTYIDQNHHLPEIPSAAQVAKEGINLGEMNAKLLKKIEELTLYLIQQKEESQRQNRIQQRQINQLKHQIKALAKASQI
ncbi:tail fiber protein [Mucilaginibacter jinjuensis]|uniref:Tail fiber protein n=1 Tax=Mucilaginibacter jinjuensis TaxID=1176721 RepID=A0ABY7TBQ0_9SPHI|nr:tail fiber protein [Mucilaginibacter jinjuensis]WCT13633.1 tail fiber protein [Mucilaginibacter jinjuensis]